MQRQFIYIINPISGVENKGSLRNIIEQETAERGFSYEIVNAVPTGNYHFLKSVIYQKGITDIVIAGGDGTVNGVIGSLYSESVRFGIIPCGSGNGLAFGAGISKDHKKALKTVFTGKAIATDAFFINGKFACMLCGVGFDAQVAHNFAKDGRRGIAAYIQKIVQHLFKAPVYPFTILVNSQTIEIEAYFISVANSNQFGNNVTIAPRASLTDGWLDIVIVAKQNKWSFLWQTLMQVSGWNEVWQPDRLPQDAGVLYFQAKNLTIQNHGMAPLHIDGEPAPTAAAFDITIQEKAFPLIYP